MVTDDEVHLIDDRKSKSERFPYQLVGALPKWGSDLHSIIYIESDGKGVLVSTSNTQ